MVQFWPMALQIASEQSSWERWVIGAIMLLGIFVALTILDALLIVFPQPSPPADPPPWRAWLQRAVDVLNIVGMIVALIVTWHLPHFQVLPAIRERIMATETMLGKPPIQRISDGEYLWVPALICTLLIVGLEFIPAFHSSTRRLRLRAQVLTMAQAVASVSALLYLLSMPADLLVARNVILMNMVFCGSLTLYREMRRRVRSGDRSRASVLGGLIVVGQALGTIISLSVILVAFTVPVLLLGGLLQGRDLLKAALQLLGILLTGASLLYLVFYGTRRLMRARGFAWIDLPNIRVALPHLKYKYNRLRKASTIADIMRKAFIRAIVADGGTLTAAMVRAAARIEPLATKPPGDHFSFVILGDPGEGDDSQLYFQSAPSEGQQEADQDALNGQPAAPGDASGSQQAIGPQRESDSAAQGGQRGAAKQIGQYALQSEPSQAPEPGEERGAAKQVGQYALESELSHPQEEAGAQPDRTASFLKRCFAIISSDVVYPAGELMDYERAVYRPYKGTKMPVYAIPGNHDWYDNMRGFFSNFVYAAASEAGDRRWRETLYAMPWDWRWWRGRFWKQITWLREHYDLRTLGGYGPVPKTDPQYDQVSKTQQRLSFFELAFPEEVPLTVLALDNGVTGSIDDAQYRWLAECLEEARAKQHVIVVLLGFPLYVDGTFAGKKEAPFPTKHSSGGQPESYDLRGIYELLRIYRVDVVMAGDTHNYQRYEVTYGPESAPNTMHHIVNGGGGAYLSLPMDWGWLDFKQGQRLSPRMAYQAYARTSRTADVAADQATVIDLFPTANDMIEKFVWRRHYVKDQSTQGWFEQRRSAVQHWLDSWLLAKGFTNALNHDLPPLFQSYVTVEVKKEAAGSWEIRIVPWFNVEGTKEPQREQDEARHIVLRAGPKLPEPQAVGMMGGREPVRSIQLDDHAQQPRDADRLVEVDDRAL